MTSDILDLIEKRKTLNKNKEGYKKVQSQIRKKIREAKEKESVDVPKWKWCKPNPTTYKNE